MSSLRSGTMPISTFMQKKLNINSPRAKLISRKIGIFIAINLQPFSIVENEAFKDLVQTLDPRYAMPSRPYFSETIVPSLYNEVRERVSRKVQNACAVSLMTDGWSSRATMSYTTVTAHFITDKWTLEERVLETLHTPESHTAEQVGDALYDTARRWNTIREHSINAVVTDNAPNMVGGVAESGLDPHLGCFAHHLNLAAQKSLESTGLSKVLARVRRIVTYFHRSNLAAHALKQKQVQLQMSPSLSKSKMLIMDCKTRWNSTLDMLERYIELEMAVLAALHSPEIKKKQTDLDNLSPNDIQNICQTISVLQPLKTATTAMCEAGTPTASSVLPLLNSILTAMAAESSDTQLQKDMKKSILKKLSPCYKEGSQRLLRLITALDPRFKKLPFLSPEEKNSVFDPMAAELTKFLTAQDQERTEHIKREPDNPEPVPVPHSVTPTSPDMPPLPQLSQGPSEPSSQPPLELSSKSTHGSSSTVQSRHNVEHVPRCALTELLGDVYVTKVTGCITVQEEIEQYKTVASIPVYDNPLQWWRVNQHKFPRLARYAKCLLSIPGTSVPSERVFSVAGTVVTAQRACLKPDNVDTLIFLKKNIKLPI